MTQPPKRLPLAVTIAIALAFWTACGAAAYLVHGMIG